MANAIPAMQPEKKEKPAEKKQEQEQAPVQQPKVESNKPRVYKLPSGTLCQDN